MKSVINNTGNDSDPKPQLIITCPDPPDPNKEHCLIGNLRTVRYRSSAAFYPFSLPKNNGSTVGVSGQPVKDCANLLPHQVVHRVHLLWTVQRHTKIRQ
jgi:hypothetical protein